MNLTPLACHADVTSGSDVVGVTDAVLTDSNCRPNAQVALAGASYFVAARLTTTTFQLERNYEGDDTSGVTCSIGVFTPEMANRTALSQQLRDYDARAVLIADNQAGLSYVYSAAVAGVPADGQVTLDNADPSAATLIRLNNADGSGQTITDRIDRWRIGDEITLRATDGSARVTYLVSSAPVDETGYRQAGLTYSGASGTLAAGADIVIERIAKGDTGAAGTAGADGADGPTGPESIGNLGLAASVAANALTMALKQADGATDPTGASPVTIAMRSEIAGAGAFAMRSVTAALSLAVPFGATLGHVSAVAGNLYWYVLDNAGAIELAVSGMDYGDVGFIGSTTAIDATADTASVIYSTTARANVPLRKIGKTTDTQTVAGTWAALPASLSLVPFGGAESEFFKSLKGAALSGNYPTVSVLTNYALNLYQDSGRFAGNAVTGTTVGAFAFPAYFSLYNNAAAAGLGKFIFNNTDYGGTGGTMDSNVKDLIDKIRGAGVRRYGVEFWAAEITAGVVSDPASVITFGGVDYQYTLFGSFFTRPPALTFHAYFRALDDDILVKLAPPGQRAFKDGVAQADDFLISVADGWVSVTIQDQTNPYDSVGYQPSILNIYAKANTNRLLVACPALMSGITAVDDNAGVIAAYNGWSA